VIGRLTGTGLWDTTFGTAGAGNLGYSALTFGTTSASNPQPQYFYAFTLDGDGKVVAVGFSESYTTATLARFAGSGAADTAFATSGRATPTLVAGGTQQQLSDVAIDAEGRIVAVGFVNSGGPLSVVTRYSAGGMVDTAFGTGGITTVSSAALAPQMAIQADGRIIAAGAVPRGGNGFDVALWRFWP
jgi:uncharacterized delta-60 repeat protein